MFLSFYSIGHVDADCHARFRLGLAMSFLTAK